LQAAEEKRQPVVEPQSALPALLTLCVSSVMDRRQHKRRGAWNRRAREHRDRGGLLVQFPDLVQSVWRNRKPEFRTEVRTAPKFRFEISHKMPPKLSVIFVLSFALRSGNEIENLPAISPLAPSSSCKTPTSCQRPTSSCSMAFLFVEGRAAWIVHARGVDRVPHAVCFGRFHEARAPRHWRPRRRRLQHRPPSYWLPDCRQKAWEQKMQPMRRLQLPRHW